jgi:Flp pilus assembly protein TadD
MPEVCLVDGNSGLRQCRREKLNAPIPPTAKKLVLRAVALADRDRPAEAVAALRKAIVLAPNYVNAHAEYIQ